jgi:hypothetical protein
LYNATLWWSPGLGNLLTAQPLAFAAITANTPYSVALTMTIPANAPRDNYDGDMHVVAAGNRLPESLHLKFKVNKPKILWTPSSVMATIAAGGTYSATVNFTSNMDLTNVTFWASPSISSVLTISPINFATITANTLYSITLSVTIPANTRHRHYDGDLRVQVGGKWLNEPLHLHFKVD